MSKKPKSIRWYIDEEGEIWIDAADVLREPLTDDEIEEMRAAVLAFVPPPVIPVVH